MQYLKKMFSFKGRVDRKHFALWWLGFILFMLLGFPLLLKGLKELSVMISDTQLIVEPIIMFATITSITISGFSVIVRRMRDAGYYGVWMLIVLVPVVNALFAIMLFFLPSETEEERKERMGDLYRAPEERQEKRNYLSFDELEREAEKDEE